jgi:proteasome lid subunit RPN8/RPN11
MHVRVKVRISSAARAAIAKGCRKAGREEACGLLLGCSEADSWTVALATCARNIAPEPWRSFEIDPAHLLAAHRAARAARAPAIVGVWHSHPGGVLLPSEADRAGADTPGWLWLIVDAAGSGMAAFLAVADAAGRFLPLAVERGTPIDSRVPDC